MTNSHLGSQKHLDLLVRGDVVLGDGISRDTLIGIRKGRIQGLYLPGAHLPGVETIEARGRLILPGAIDAHVHCYSLPQEGFLNATRAAAAGGVTTLIDMPYDAGRPVVSTAELESKKGLVAKEAVVDVALLGTIKKVGGLAQIGPLAEAGVCGFKVSLFETDPDRFPRIPDGELLEAFRLVGRTGLPIGVHAENDEIVTRETERQRALSPTDPLAHSRSRPVVAEAEATLRALELALWSGVRLHIYHASHPRIFKLIDWYRDQGLEVTAETCTHYLCLDESALLEMGAKAKVNPPIRTKSDQDGLWRLCGEGRVDFITSDHAPWNQGKKNNPDIFKNASGTPGVETLLPLIYSEGVKKGRFGLTRMIDLLSRNPARTFGLFPRKGEIRIGADADLVILDPDKDWILDEKELNSIAGWSPYHGWTMRGRVCRTMVRGRTVYDGEKVVAEPGSGEFVRPVRSG